MSSDVSLTRICHSVVPGIMFKTNTCHTIQHYRHVIGDSRIDFARQPDTYLLDFNDLSMAK